MLSKLALVTIVLFAATIAVGSVGVFYYYSYRGTLINIVKQQPVGSLLSRISSAEYKIYSFPQDVTYLVKLTGFPSNDTMLITVFNQSGSEVGYLVVHYNETNVTWIYINFDSLTGNYSGSNVSTYLTPLLTSVEVSYNPLTGSITVASFPGLGPFFGLYYYSSYYNINWQATLSGQATTEEASIGYLFTPVKFEGKTYNGVEITISPTTSFLGTSGAYSISAEMIDVNGVPTAVQLNVGTGAANYVSMSLLGLEVT